MRIALGYGLERLEVEVAEGRWLASHRPPPALPDPPAAVRAALEQPFGYPPLRRALTPDDHVAVVVDEHLPGLAGLLVPILEHLVEAGVDPAAMTLVCPPSASRQTWADDLPDALQDVHLEIHSPTDRRRLSYLATMRSGRRLYLNRTVVDADQVVVLARRRYDPAQGVTGAEGALYPILGDEATRAEMGGSAAHGARAVHQQAEETAWLLGAPFYVQIIEAGGDGLAHVVAGSAQASAEGQRLLASCWKQVVPAAADLVIASVSGDPARQTFADLAAALACAARVTQPDGRIVLLCRACPALGPGGDVLLSSDEPRTALEQLRRQPTPETMPALLWAQAAAHARVYLLSDLPDETAEDLFATPLADADQVQRLLDQGGSCLFLEDAHKTLAVVER